MTPAEQPPPNHGSRATGGCLCGAVRYEVRGPLRDVVVCHCHECRRWGGNAATFAATRPEHLTVVESRGLRWFPSPDSDAHADRGFCGECGSALFWRPGHGQRISIAAGSLDEPTGLTIRGHWYTSQLPDWYRLPDDGLPRDDPSVTALPDA